MIVSGVNVWCSKPATIASCSVLSWAREVGLTNKNSDILKWCGSKQDRLAAQQRTSQTEELFNSETAWPLINQRFGGNVIESAYGKAVPAQRSASGKPPTRMVKLGF